MNSIPKISARAGVSKDAMLAALDREIRVAQRQTKGSAKGGWISKMQYDSQMLVAVLNWAWDMRVAQLNDEDVGHSSYASGQRVSAPSSSLNGEADGLSGRARDGHRTAAVASPTHSNGDGHSRGAAQSGPALTATPLLLNEDDEGQFHHAEIGRETIASSSSPNGDGVGLGGDASDGLLNAAAPSPTHRDTGGQCGLAVNGRCDDAVPYREPTSAELRGRLSAKFRVAERVLSSLDTYQINGKPIGLLTFGEVSAALDSHKEQAGVMRQILRYAANVSPNQLVREIVKPTDLDEMIRKAKELVDVA